LLVLAVVLFHAFVPFEALLPPVSVRAREAGELRVHFLDVGQGDCTVVEFPSGKALVVDSGDGSFSSRTNVLRYLKGLSLTDISMLATHADGDHTGGFESLLRVYEVETVYLPLVSEESESYRNFQSTVEKSGAATQTITRYGVIADESGAYAVCISPLSTESDGDANDTSTVLFLHYGGVNILLAGDISEAREKKLRNEYSLLEGIFDKGEYRVRLEDTDILKVSHHGSADSCSREWLELLSPKTAVVSCGKGNEYAHPSAEAMERLNDSGAELYRTDELGNIVVCVKDGGYTVEY